MEDERRAAGSLPAALPGAALHVPDLGARRAAANGLRLLPRGRFEVYAFDWRDGIERRLTSRRDGTGYRVPSRVTPDGETVWWWDDEGGSELGAWRAQPFAGGESRPATDLPPAYSAWLALGSGFAIVGRSTGAEGTTVDLVRDGRTDRRLYAHREHASVGRLSRDETLWALSHSEHGDDRHRALRVLEVDGRAVADLWDGPGKGLQPGHWSPIAGDQRLVIHHERDGLTRPLIYDARTGREQALAIDLPGEVEGDWYPDGRALLLGHHHRGRSELYRYGLDDGSLVRLPTPPGSIDWAAVRPRGPVWYAVSTSTDPRRVVTVDGGHVLPRAEVDVPRGRPYRDLAVGPIHGFVVEPEGPRPHPAIFIVHGGPSSHDRDAFSPTVQAWVDHGYAVALVNYRGSTGYGQPWRDALVGRPGLTELEDVGAVHDRLVADGIVDARRTVLSGGSWGGYLTLLGLGVQPERWALGIARLPIGDYLAAFEDEMEPLKRMDAALFGGFPHEVPETYRRSNPITYVESVRSPAMLLVGRNDPRCPARSSDVYVGRLRELGKPFELYEYEAGHGSLVVDEELHQLELQLAFAARHLGVPAPA